MTTNNVQQNPGMSEPTDLSAVNNLNAITTSGYGGSHAVFDKNHYKGQMRLAGKLIEFNASQGAISNLGYVWSINLIAFHDNYETEMLMLPPTELVVKQFMDAQMQILIETYKPVTLYFPATKHTILASEFIGNY